AEPHASLHLASRPAMAQDPKVNRHQPQAQAQAKLGADGDAEA
ncbi:hypothetical protein A2U01_0102634, partial [Trifolium medium]|nr:hypothetical protein [Trifolium medium]